MLQSKRITGFSLIELSVVLTILSVVIAGILPGITGAGKSRDSEVTQVRMRAVEDALLAFRIANKRLPCPSDITLNEGTANFGSEVGTIGAGTCVGAYYNNATTYPNAMGGGVPVRAIGLPDEYANDAWGRRFDYHVDKRFTATNATDTYGVAMTSNDPTTPIGLFQVNDALGGDRTSATYRALYVLVSHGPDGHGGFVSGGNRYNRGITNAQTLANCNCTSAAAAATYATTFVQRSRYLNSSNSLDAFDDLVDFKTRAQVDTTSGGGGGSDVWSVNGTSNLYPAAGNAMAVAIGQGTNTIGGFTPMLAVTSADSADWTAVIDSTGTGANFGALKVTSTGGYSLWATNANTTGIALRADANGTGLTYGVYGTTLSTTGVGVYGNSTAASGTNYGVYGQNGSTGTNATGVYGNATGATGATRGVQGYTASTGGVGVYGYATSSTGTNYGVYGNTSSANGTGVYGISPGTSGVGVYGNATAGTGTTYGVYANNGSATGYGLYSYATSPTGINYGIYTKTASTSGTGLVADATATTGSTIGMMAANASTSGTALSVRAYANSGSTTGINVYNASPTGTGINITGGGTGTSYSLQANNTGTIGFGVYASVSGSGTAVSGLNNGGSGTGVFGYATAAGTYGVQGLNTSTTGYGVNGNANATTGVNYGVYGQSASTTGYGVYCNATYANGCAGNKAWFNASDERLKKDIHALADKDGLDAIRKLKPIHYVWRATDIGQTPGEHIGLIAQDVEKVFPELVGRGPDAKVKGDNGRIETITNVRSMSYAELTVPIIKAVQQIDAIVTALQKGFDELKTQIADIVKRLDGQDDAIKMLQQENKNMQQENAELKARLDVLEAKQTPATVKP